jgi:hypothetical protein
MDCERGRVGLIDSGACGKRFLCDLMGDLNRLGKRIDADLVTVSATPAATSGLSRDQLYAQPSLPTGCAE